MISIKNLNYFAPQLKLKILNNINLEINSGDFVIIIGRNGAGKSTLLKAIEGEIEPLSGKIMLNKHPLCSLSLKKRTKILNIVTQSIEENTIGEMTVMENMCLAIVGKNGVSISKYDNKYRRKMFLYYLSRFHMGLEKKIDTCMSSLSGGQRQAVSFAMALVKMSNHPSDISPSHIKNNDSILLLDEITAALDIHSANTVMDVVSLLINEIGCTTVMVTHNILHAIKYGERMVILKDGEIIGDYSGESKRNLSIEDINEILGS